VAGIDVMNRLVDLSAREGQRIFLLGAREDVVGRVRREFTARGANVVGHRDGYWRRHMTDAEMAQTIRLLNVDILFVALPSPMKEDFIYGFREAMNVGLSVGVGGSFDVVVGRTRRAPAIIQRLGLEWLFRLVLEPRRMFKRYAVGNSKFLWYLVRELLRRR
jgi:N-acetylglucosaminyldiphosphoundecaprenol N-acetyl-beta-D-mannosaminyltransferase